MRDFILRNSLGNEWDLTQSFSFLSSPKGLGMERKIEYIQIGNRNVQIEGILKQKAPSGKIYFDTYQRYEAFCKFIQHRPLILKYTTADTYLMQVEVEKLTKGEMETAGLPGEITLNGITAWYKQTYVENISQDGGKVYPFTYDYVYTDQGMDEIEFITDSTASSPVKINILGPCVNPSWSHYVNGSLQITGKVACNIVAGRRLVIDTTKIPYEIAEYDSSGNFIQDLYQNSDFSTQRFVLAGYGTNTINFTHEGDGEIKAVVEVRVEYEAV